MNSAIKNEEVLVSNPNPMVILRDLKIMQKRLGLEAEAHHHHGDIGCDFFWRRKLEIDRLINNFENELPK